VLDVGAGSGVLWPILRERLGSTALLAAVDLSAAMLKQGPPDAAAALVADGEELPFRDGAFGWVFCNSCFPHFTDQEGALGEMRRVLAPGGVAIVEFVHLVPVYPRSPDLWRFTGPGAERLLRDAGLEPVEVVRMGRAPGYLGLMLLAWLNRHNRGRTRFLTELPIRALYVLVQVLGEALDRCWSRSGEVMSRLIVARSFTSS